MKRLLLLIPLAAILLILMLPPQGFESEEAETETRVVVGFVELLSESSWRDRVSASIADAAAKDGMQLIMEEQSVNSMLYGHYRVTELLVTAARLLKESGGDAERVYPELNDPGALMRAAGSAGGLRQAGESILNRLMDNRGDGSGAKRYGGTIAKAKEYIYENCDKPSLSLNSVAKYIGFSPNHFSTVFSQNTGETFISFLTRVRMERAKALLTSSGLPSAEVAYRVGYNDSNYFRYLFKKHFGKSPREYRGM